ncbi:MAG: hypothetical protein IPG50_21660 [Myxococcales bacterium]|nr:hypothetical protein [Myxococcales bacterium]
MQLTPLHSVPKATTEQPTMALLDAVDAAALGDAVRVRHAAWLRDALLGFKRERRTFDVTSLVETALDVATTMSKRSTRIVRSYFRGQPALAEGDWSELSLGVLQVLENAIAAANERAAGHVLVSIFPSITGGAYIEINDNGAGMSPEAREQAFTPFYTTRGPGHAGLGLSIARAMIRSSGGSLALDSSKGVGTVAMISLR